MTEIMTTRFAERDVETRSEQPAQARSGEVMPPAKPPAPPSHGGFVQMFGLDYRVALLTIVVDTLVFGGNVITMGLLYPVELISAVVLGIITYKIQIAWYGDDRQSAIIKALIIGLITAIPVPISGIVAGPGGVLGLVRLMRGKRSA